MLIRVSSTSLCYDKRRFSDEKEIMRNTSKFGLSLSPSPLRLDLEHCCTPADFHDVSDVLLINSRRFQADLCKSSNAQ